MLDQVEEFGVATSGGVWVAAGAKSRQLGLATKPWTGDFDQMLERQVIRVYSPYSRSLRHSISSTRNSIP
jgi:hypothetical protein